jgi:hypothetical protein
MKKCMVFNEISADSGQHQGFCIGQQSINEINVQIQHSRCVLFKESQTFFKLWPLPPLSFYVTAADAQIEDQDIEHWMRQQLFGRDLRSLYERGGAV